MVTNFDRADPPAGQRIATPARLTARSVCQDWGCEVARADALIRLQQTLQKRRNELRKRLGTGLRELGRFQVAASTGDSADAAFDSGSEELTSALAELEGRELAQIETALRRLKNGTYGVCEGCLSKIPVARLNALPYSTLCVKCQREAENDSEWLANKIAERGSNWDKVSDGDDLSREMKISELEMNLTR